MTQLIQNDELEHARHGELHDVQYFKLSTDTVWKYPDGHEVRHVLLGIKWI